VTSATIASRKPAKSSISLGGVFRYVSSLYSLGGGMCEYAILSYTKLQP